MFGTVGQEDHHSTAAHRDNGRKLISTATRTPASEPVIEPAGISCDRVSLAEAESDGKIAALTPGISDTLHSTRTISTSSAVAVEDSLHSNAAAMMPVVPKDEDLRATDEVTSLRSKKETGEVSIKQTLRTYQEELIDKINNTRGKTRNVIVCAPTGSGKTLVAAKHCADVITAVRCDGKPTACVYFIVPTNHLAHQQAKYMNETLDGIRHVGLITGDQTEETTLSEQSQISDIVVMTPEILLNDLKKNKMKLSDIRLLVFDECHHTDKKHPYMQIMDFYLKEKFGETESMGSLPQILGMTATLGMGSVSSLEDAKSHVLTLCANLDSAEIVQVLDNCDELYEYVPYPNTELMAVGKREMEDPFHKEIVKVMKEIQHKADPPETCHEYGSQEYETIINQHRRTLEEGENYEALFYVNMLISYNQGLQIYRYMGKEETLDFFKEKFSSGEPGEGRAKLIRTMENERKSIAEQLQQLETIRSFPNPKLEALKRLLLDEFDKSTTAKGIVFMTTRQLTGALVKWIKTDEHLRDRVRPKQLVGAHGNSEMYQLNKAEQLQAIQEFRGGNCNLLVATTIGEEGLDIPKCHFVVCYDLVMSEIAEVQARGRARVCRSSRFVEIVTQGSGNEDRAKANKHREKLMNEASASVRYMPEKELLNEIQKRQMERLRKLRDKAKQLQARHESNSPADVTLHCKKCGVTACQGSDILCIGTQHVVPGTRLDEKKIKKDHMKSPDKYCKTGKISCKDCGASWGVIDTICEWQGITNTEV
jgi:ERCC4-related helicase